jgi:hypothetical protein
MWRQTQFPADFQVWLLFFKKPWMEHIVCVKAHMYFPPQLCIARFLAAARPLFAVFITIVFGDQDFLRYH